jgi:hypothetical protein
MNFILLPVCTVAKVVLHLGMMPTFIASFFVHYVGFQVLAVFFFFEWLTALVGRGLLSEVPRSHLDTTHAVGLL